MHAPALFKDGLKGRHVLAFMVAFYAVIFAMTGSFVWLAVKTFPGDVPGAYRRGLRYNETLTEAARQDALGWRVVSRFDPARGVVSLALTDRAGKFLSGQEVEAKIRRPATQAFDRAATFREAEPGLYSASLPLDSGSWDVDVEVNPGGSGPFFKERLRLWIPPHR